MSRLFSHRPAILRENATPPAVRWLATGCGLLVAAAALGIAAAGEGTVPGDVEIARLVQRPVSPTLDTLARQMSIIGDDFPGMVVLALLGVVILISRGRRDFALFLALAAALRAIGPGLKVLINSPRPTLETVVIVAQANGLGFPSGHAMGAALFYGAIAFIAPQAIRDRALARGVQWLAAVMMILIALARVRLGVHWPSDVVGGLLFGLAIVCGLWAGMVAWQQRGRER